MKRHLLLTVALVLFAFPSHAFWNSDVDKAKEFMKAGMYPKAIELLDKRINDKPTDAEAHFQLGLCYFHTGNYSGADERFSSAVAFNPDYKAMIAQRCKKAGFDSLEKGQQAKAVRLFEMAIKYQPDLRKEIAQRCFEKGKSLLESAIAQNADYEKSETE